MEKEVCVPVDCLRITLKDGSERLIELREFRMDYLSKERQEQLNAVIGFTSGKELIKWVKSLNGRYSNVITFYEKKKRWFRKREKTFLVEERWDYNRYYAEEDIEKAMFFTRFDKKNPSISTLAEKLSADCFIEWCRDRKLNDVELVKALR
jgi:hypothetical protein